MKCLSYCCCFSPIHGTQSTASATCTLTNICICTHRHSHTLTHFLIPPPLPPTASHSTLPLSVCFIMRVCWVDILLFSQSRAGIPRSAPLSNFPTDRRLLSTCLCLPLLSLSLYLCSPIWDGMPQSPPFCRHDLNIVCPPLIFPLPAWTPLFLFIQ